MSRIRRIMKIWRIFRRHPLAGAGAGRRAHKISLRLVWHLEGTSYRLPRAARGFIIAALIVRLGGHEDIIWLKAEHQQSAFSAARSESRRNTFSPIGFVSCFREVATTPTRSRGWFPGHRAQDSSVKISRAILDQEKFGRSANLAIASGLARLTMLQRNMLRR